MESLAVKKFYHSKYGTLYAINKDGTPLFCAAQVCSMLDCKIDENVDSYLRCYCKKYEVLVDEDYKQLHFMSMKDIEWAADLHRTYRAMAVKKWIKDAVVPKLVEKRMCDVKALPPIEHNGQRVITTELLAQVYETDTDNIKHNFNNHKENFKEGIHYYLLQGEALKRFRLQVNDIPLQISPMTRSLYLWTERGANRHCKILDTPKAWEQFDHLEEVYFMVKEAKNQMMVLPKDYSSALRALADQVDKCNALEAKIETDRPKVERYDKVLNTADLVPISVIAKEYGLNAVQLNSILHEKGIQFKNGKNWMLYQKYADKGYVGFDTALRPDNDGVQHTFMHMKWTQAGREFIHNLLDADGYIREKDKDYNF